MVSYPEGVKVTKPGVDRVFPVNPGFSDNSNQPGSGCVMAINAHNPGGPPAKTRAVFSVIHRPRLQSKVS
jgi:hypothetical protein